MKIAPTPIIQEPELLPDLRDLFHERPLLAYRGPETVRHALRMLSDISTDVLAVEAAMEALVVEGEILS
jgi:hypothetical protein